VTTTAEVTGSSVPAPHHHHDHSAARTGRRPRWLVPAAVGAVGALATAYVAWQDPNGDGAYPLCPTFATFGVDCPGCGGLRATHALTQGDVLAAFDHNVLVAVTVPLMAVVWFLWLLRSLGVRTPALPAVTPRAWWALGALLLAFTIVRNLSGVGLFEYLAATA
jgi:hypothetical protein